jgi:Tol biopolymer transport system component
MVLRMDSAPRRPFPGLLLLALLIPAGAGAVAPDTLRLAEETHLRNVRQLTFGGENAEAYFSPDGGELVFQSTRPPFECDQIFRMPVAGGDPVLVSTGEGRTTCAYFMPDGESILYASTHPGAAACPPPPDRSKGYVWALYPEFDIFVRRPDGGLRRLTDTPGYDAEATVSPRGDRIVFTSTRDGDIDLYSMKPDGTDVRRLTDRAGYDGGAFYSADGSEIVFRAGYPATPEERADYAELLTNHLIRPGKLSLYVMKADGSDQRLVLENGAANFAPYFFPDGERIVFSSNLGDPKGRNFDLYLIRKDGTGLERVTWNPTFDGFPMFSPDGKRLVFASNRNNRAPNDTNVFIADWVE